MILLDDKMSFSVVFIQIKVFGFIIVIIIIIVMPALALISQQYHVYDIDEFRYMLEFLSLLHVCQVQGFC